MKSITLHKPDGIASFEKGATLIRDGKETKIKVIGISYWFGKTTIKLSDKSKIIFKGFPVSYVK